MIWLDPLRQSRSLSRAEPPVDFDAKVDCLADCLPVTPHRVDGVLDLVGVSLRVGYAGRFVQKRGEVAYRGETGLLGRNASLDQLFLGVAEDVIVNARLVAAFSPQELVAGNTEVFSSN